MTTVGAVELSFLTVIVNTVIILCKAQDSECKQQEDVFDVVGRKERQVKSWQWLRNKLRAP